MRRKKSSMIEVLTLTTNGGLTISENVYDGFPYSFKGVVGQPGRLRCVKPGQVTSRHSQQHPDPIPLDLEQVVVGIERLAGPLRQHRLDRRREHRQLRSPRSQVSWGCNRWR